MNTFQSHSPISTLDYQIALLIYPYDNLFVNDSAVIIDSDSKSMVHTNWKHTLCIYADLFRYNINYIHVILNRM